MELSKVTPNIYLLFIGGAGDKESFLWRNISLPFTNIWPHYTVKNLSEHFLIDLQKSVNEQLNLSLEKLSQYCRLEYLSYTEVFFDELKSVEFNSDNINSLTNPKLQSIMSNIGEHTHVYIIGHSLGGWNGAHLSHILSILNVKVDYLVTLDPVGSGNHETIFNQGYFVKQAQIYHDDPVPIADTWINIRGFHINVTQKIFSSEIEDWVAWVGGQWLIDQTFASVRKQINKSSDIPHRDAEAMFNLKIDDEKSAQRIVIDAVIEQLADILNKC